MKTFEKEAQERMLRQQIRKYSTLFPRYKLYAETLGKVLEKAAKQYAPLAVVQARPKTISSFAEKILRKEKYKDPINEITDLCGARVTTHLPDEVKAVGKFIESHFEIDWDNTVDVGQRLKPTEFGYRSVHYIAKFKEGVFPTKEIDVSIPRKILGLKAEIQVRTVLEHAWADLCHDVSYKGAFKIPKKWERELASLAATLESIDNEFSRIHHGLQAYAANYDAYLSPEQMRDEIERLETILKYDPSNVAIDHRIGKLAITLGDWQKAIDTLSDYAKSEYPPLLRDLGVALCKKHKNSRKSAEFLQGQKYLEAACAPPNRDPDAFASLAGTYAENDENRARELYRRAFEIDPSNPYSLGNFLECEIEHRRDVSVLSVAGPLIEAAIERCRQQADVGMNLPWAFYDMGKFYLLLGKPYLSLAAYAKAIQISVADWMICTSLASIERMTVIRNQLSGHEWVRRLLLVGLAAKFPTSKLPAARDGKTGRETVEGLASSGSSPIEGPVVILVGAGDVSVDAQIQSYQPLVLEAFRDFKGTVISGGTAASIGKLAGELQQQYPDAICTVGYVPRSSPAGVQIDKRYSEIRQIEGEDFSPAEPLQCWIDLVASGFCPSDVKILGINGGDIAAFEYKLALSLGAYVAVVQDSGREAARILADADWGASEKLVQMPIDSATLHAFIGMGTTTLEPKIREAMAKAIHHNYVADQISNGRSQDPSLRKWEGLHECLKESNRQQAHHIAKKLDSIGCTIHAVKNRAAAIITFTESETETLAKMEHARWNVERLLDGWKWGKTKDVAKKISPHLVPWNELPQDLKEWDRETVRKIPEFLAAVGIEIRRKV